MTLPPPASLPTFADVRAASHRIAGHVHRTPVLTSSRLDAELGARVFFKCENFQKVGAFKARGATNAILALPSAGRPAGVLTHSSGNHGAAVAYAAARSGLPCVVVMQVGASPLKAAAVRGYGAEVVECPVGERESTVEAIALDRGMAVIHPFENPLVIAGQATAALELLEEVPDLDAIVAPIGGGGLLAGTALVVAARSPTTAIVGAEPIVADDAFRSLRDGVRHPAVPRPATLADGLLTGIGSTPFTILCAARAEVITVEEDAIVAGCRFLLHRMKILVEPSAATAIAALRRDPGRWRNHRVGLILSGGNTDLSWLAR